MRWKLSGRHPGTHHHLEKRYLASDHHSGANLEDWNVHVCERRCVGGWVIGLRGGRDSRGKKISEMGGEKKG